MKYRVSVTDEAATEGTEETVETATSEEQAKWLHAVAAGSTVERLEASGLTRWTVEEVTA